MADCSIVGTPASVRGSISSNYGGLCGSDADKFMASATGAPARRGASSSEWRGMGFWRWGYGSRSLLRNVRLLFSFLPGLVDTLQVVWRFSTRRTLWFRPIAFLTNKRRVGERSVINKRKGQNRAVWGPTFLSRLIPPGICGQ